MRQLCLTGKLPLSARNLSLQQASNCYLLPFFFIPSGEKNADVLTSSCAGHLTKTTQVGSTQKRMTSCVTSKVSLDINQIPRYSNRAAKKITFVLDAACRRLQALLPSFISVSKGKLMQNVYRPWHKRWWCGSLQEDLCAKSWKHLCKHMALFQPCRQCSHSLKIDVRGNIPCPGAMLGMTLNI